MFGSNNGSIAATTQSGNLFGSHLSDRNTSQKRSLAAEYCSKLWQQCPNLETNFTRKTCTLEAETSVSG